MRSFWEINYKGMFLLLKILKLIIVWVFYHEIPLWKLFLLLLMCLHSYSSLLVLSIFVSFTVFPHFHACLVFFFFIDIEKYHIWNLREPYFSTTFLMDNFRWICLTLPTEMSQFLSFFLYLKRWRRQSQWIEDVKIYLLQQLVKWLLIS